MCAKIYTKVRTTYSTESTVSLFAASVHSTDCAHQNAAKPMLIEHKIYTPIHSIQAKKQRHLHLLKENLILSLQQRTKEQANTHTDGGKKDKKPITNIKQ